MTADLVLLGGSVVTVDPACPRAEAVAVAAGRIVAVGSDRDVRELIGAGTDVVELQGQTVLPGFQDAHVHPVHGGLARLRCELHDTRGREGYLAVIAEYLLKLVRQRTPFLFRQQSR